jgi:hypothetical protein
MDTEPRTIDAMTSLMPTFAKTFMRSLMSWEQSTAARATRDAAAVIVPCG